MKKTSLKDLPSVHQVLLEIKDDISLHNNYLKEKDGFVSSDNINNFDIFIPNSFYLWSKKFQISDMGCKQYAG